jgi:serine/threonine protein kinase/tetratricopeptide (TPR) repeat protein
MTPERWKQVREVLETALDVASKERAAFLSGACMDDFELRREVEELLAAYEEDFLEHTPLDGINRQPGEEPSLEGHFIGPYKIIREIGQGGMGAVFLAMRADDQYKKRVAIKLVKRGMDTDYVLSRFRHERQILASLDHPNIARFLDGGATEDGLPYFVMEYIEGQPIDKYCDENKLTTVERLKLFQTVCSAVHYAHQNLIVHRDLKPGNIIVTAEGTPKLMDFGIAKLLNPNLYAQTLVPTALSQRLLTPDYASPEQVKGKGITTASDVYSLGVLLYELLTGHHPYQFKSYTPQEIERVICEEQPEKPSTAINRVETVATPEGKTGVILTPELVSRTREGQPDKLKKKLAGDLDNIVLMAMRKEPLRRYLSVEQFSQDIRRYLEGMPVLARKDTFAYRSAKFVRRNRVAVTVSIILLLSMVAFITAVIRQSARAERERDRAEQVTTFLVKMIEEASPDVRKGRVVTIQEVLDKGAKKIIDELHDQPEVKARLMETMGGTYGSLGLFDRATPLLEESLKIRKQTFGDEHLEVAKGMDSLAEAYQSQGEYKEAEKLFRESLAIRRQRSGKDTLDVAFSLNNLAYLLKTAGNYKEAEPLYRESVELRRQLSSIDPEGVGWGLNNFSQLLRAEGNDEAAEPLLREALELFLQLKGEDYSGTAIVKNNLAGLLRDKGDYETAEQLSRDAVAYYRKIYDAGHPSLAYPSNTLALTLCAKGDYENAETGLRESLAIRRTALGENHPLYATNLYYLALVLHEKGNSVEAEKLYRQALQIRRQTLQGQHPDLAPALIALAKLLIERGEVQEAESLLREGIQIQRAVLLGNCWQIDEAESVMGSCLAALKRFEEAEPMLLQSYNALKAKRPASDRRIEQARKRLLDLYLAWKKPDKAVHYR